MATIWNRITGRGDAEERAISYQSVWGSGSDLNVVMNGGLTGQQVNENTALKLSAVYGCIRIITDNTATLPVGVFVRRGGTRFPSQRPVWLDTPNPEMTRVDFFDQVFMSLLVHGNAYVLTPRDALGNVTELWPVHPNNVQIHRNEDMSLTYIVSNTDGKGKITQVPLNSDEICHIPGIRMPGNLYGLSPLQAAMDVFSVGLAAQEQAGRFYKNGSTPGGIITIPKEAGDISQEAVDALKASWNSYHQGTQKSSGLAVLTAGMTYMPITLSPEQAQFLQTRQFQIQEICRLYGVPSHLLNDTSNSTSWGSGLEEQSIGFVRWTLSPWLERVEASLQRLLPGAANGDFLKFNLDGLMRGNTTARYQAYSSALQNGWLSVNEVRAMEDRAPVQGGDQYLQPLNMTTLGSGDTTQ
jgi:HK97 family phage portal protein